MKKTISVLLVLAAVFVALASLPAAAADTEFSDVREKDWFCRYVREVAKEGIMTGTAKGVFSPKSNLTRADMGDSSIMLSNRMLSTYINALADNGFVIEKLIEETDKEKAETATSDFGRKALMLPTAFIIKARKAENR